MSEEVDVHAHHGLPPQAPADYLAGGGEMGALMRSFDWSKTGLGVVASWPQSLRTAVSIMLDSAFGMVVAWGPEFVFLYNDRYRPVLGATKHPGALGRPAKEIFPEVWHFIGPLFEKTRHGEAVGLEDVLIPLDRNGYLEDCYFTLSYSPIRDESGGVGGMLAVVAETTVRVHGERQLATLRELAALAQARNADEACADAANVLANNPSDVPFSLMYLLEPDGRHVRLAGVTGLARGTGAAAEVLSLDDDSGWRLRDCQAARAPLVLGELGARFGRLPGGPYDEPSHTAVVLPMLRAGYDEPHGFFIAGVSPRRALDDRYRTFFELGRDHIVAAIGNALAHEEARVRAEALAEIDRAKTAFFSNVSHEFRTPLTLMLGPMEDALATGALAGDDLDATYRNALRLQKLVNALLDFSRIEAGRMHASYIATHIARLTLELAGMFESAMERAGLEYIVRCDPITEPIYLDKDMYEKIVLNLLSNALKFTFKGRVEVTLRDAGRQVELRVRDTGVGVAAAELPRLFERFHRIEGSRARTYEGSGIGLALVNDLVKLHGGTVSVDSALGHGTSFTVTLLKGTRHLPRDKIAADAPPAVTTTNSAAFVEEAMRWLPVDAEHTAPAPGGGLGPAIASPPAAPRILVADDSADMREYLRRVLAPHWLVETVADGAAALDASRATAPDLVVADMMMPVLDGFELLRRLRADVRTRSIPVVMLSARAGEESRLEGLQIGADDYLVKPFSAKELIARIRTHLELSRLRREAELQYEKLNALFEQAPAVICVLAGPEHVFRLANPPYLEVTGNRPLLGRPIREALPELEGQGVYERLDRAYTTGERVVESEVFVKLQRGARLEETYWNFVYEPYRDRSGRMEGVMVFGFDLTAQVLARQRATRAEAAAEAANRAKDEFLAVLGHELRNPLAPILTALQLMRMRGGDHALKERTVIERQANHLLRLIDDLLDVSRIARGKVTLAMQRIELAPVVSRALEMTGPLFEQRRHELVVDVAAHELAIDADPERLAQVISNLLMNAAKYTPPGGHVTVSASKSHGQVALHVRDSGIGIAPDMLPNVFDMFVQERQTIDRSRGGLGLGLAIVKSLVALHGGSIEAHSEGRDQGSEFIVRLPAAAPDEQLRHEPIAPLPSRLGAEELRRILIVDDNEDAAELLASSLDVIGHATRVAHDAPEALRIVGEFVPQIALVDIGLPVMDGHELARRLLEQPNLEGLKLVALTGYGQESDRQRSQAAGFMAHLVKPVKLDHLLTVIRDLGDATRSARLGASAAPSPARE
jgi:PAS domain S-box-containing protein